MTMVRAMFDLIDHGCCPVRRKRCSCMCHDYEIHDYSRAAPSRDDFDRMQLLWHVSKIRRHGGRQFVGIVKQDLDSGGFGAYGDQVGCFAMVEEPFDAAAILWVWALGPRPEGI